VFVEFPFSAENELEAKIIADPAWQEGARWGEPRPGHPEGTVASHIAEVLSNVDRHAVDRDDRARLRLAALVHDTFKYRVDQSRPKVAGNHHAMLARRFAEGYVDDVGLLEVIELHDEAYNSWAEGVRSGDWAGARARARDLLGRLGGNLPFYLRFYRADNETGDKSQEPLEWFERLTATDEPGPV
jgi:HD domain